MLLCKLNKTIVNFAFPAVVRAESFFKALLDQD